MQKGNTRITAIKSGSSGLDESATTRLDAKRQQRLERSAAKSQARANRKGLATVTKFDPEDGYEVKEGADTYAGRRSISNGAIGVGDRVTHKGKLIDAMRKPKAPQPVDDPTPSLVEPIKYLYSLVDGEKRKFFVGGHVKQPIEVFSLPRTANVYAASIDNLGKDKYAIDIAYDDKTVRYVGKSKKWSVDTPLNDSNGYAVYYPRGYGFWQTALPGGFTNFEDPTIPDDDISGDTITSYGRPDYIYDGQYIKGSQYVTRVISPGSGSSTTKDYIFPGNLQVITTTNDNVSVPPGGTITGTDTVESLLFFNSPVYKMHPRLEIGYGVQRNYIVDFGAGNSSGTDQLIAITREGAVQSLGSVTISSDSASSPAGSQYTKLFSGLDNPEIAQQVLGKRGNYQLMMTFNTFDKTFNTLFFQNYTDSKPFDFSFRLLNFETNQSVNKTVKVYPPALETNPTPTIWAYSYAP